MTTTEPKARWTVGQKLMAVLAVVVWAPILYFVVFFVGLIIVRWIGSW